MNVNECVYTCASVHVNVRARESVTEPNRMRRDGTVNTLLSAHLHWPGVRDDSRDRCPVHTLFSVLVSACFTRVLVHAVLMTFSCGRYDHCPHLIDEDMSQRAIRECL